MNIKSLKIKFIAQEIHELHPDSKLSKQGAKQFNYRNYSRDIEKTKDLLSIIDWLETNPIWEFNAAIILAQCHKITFGKYQNY